MSLSNDIDLFELLILVKTFYKPKFSAINSVPILFLKTGLSNNLKSLNAWFNSSCKIKDPPPQPLMEYSSKS